MLSIAVVDDEPVFQQIICGYIEQYGQKYHQQFRTTCFKDGLDIADEYKAKWDIIFLDIRMEHMDGMSAA